MKKFIFIPVVNRFDLLEKAVRGIKLDLYDEYIIFNNSEQTIPEEVYSGTQFRVLNPERRMTFTETQNAMRQYAIDNNFDFYSFMHNDGEVHDDTDVALVKYAESLTENWGVIFTNYDVLCAFNTKAFEHIGVWGDKDWPSQQNGYLLDNDYYRRVRSNGYVIKEITEREVTYVPADRVGGVSHFGSATLKDPNEQSLWDSQVKSVYDHYFKKWGGESGQEKYTHPYDIDPKDKINFPNWFDEIKASTNFENILREYNGKDGLEFLEIGSFTGDSAVYMLENILTSDSAKITCVDTWAGSLEHAGELQEQFKMGEVEKRFDERMQPFSNKVLKHKATSTEFLINNRDKSYDFIYIDGDHTANTVLSDAVLSWDLLKVGGVMAFDDYEWTHPDGDGYAPRLAIDSFLNVHKPYLEEINRGWQLWVRKIR
jgi:predicted O-methyltransferase YrrM